MAFRILIDPGHGGTDPGAVFQGRQEKDDVLKLALAVGRILEDYGIDVVYSRTEDFYDSPYEKAMKGNEAEADLFLSLHRNAALSPGSGSGADLLVYADTGFSSDTANQIGNELDAIGLPFNGITERPNLAVLRRTKMPSVLVEVGFLDNESDNQFFDENFDAIAQAIAQGVLNAIEEDSPSSSKEAPRTDSPETFAMNSDSRSALGANDPAEQMQEQDYLDFSPRPPIMPGSPMPPTMPGSPMPPTMPGTSTSPGRPDRPGRPGDNEQTLYRVQVGAFSNSMFASQLLNQLLLEGYPAFIVYSDGLYRVQVGAFARLENAVRMEQRLRSQGYQTYITT